jgi:hypothetical protein
VGGARNRVRGGATFLCPVCRALSKVTRTQRVSEFLVRRDRLCRRGHRFETVEIIRPARQT